MCEEITYPPADNNSLDSEQHGREEVILAGIFRRFTAGLIDHIICLILFFLLIMLFFKQMIFRLAFSSFFFGVYFFLMTLFVEVYFFTCEFYLKGQTPGKILFKIMVINKSGDLSIAQIFIRNFLRCSYLIPPLFIIPDFFLITLGKDKKRIGDLIANTVVVKKFIG